MDLIFFIIETEASDTSSVAPYDEPEEIDIDNCWELDRGMESEPKRILMAKWGDSFV